MAVAVSLAFLAGCMEVEQVSNAGAKPVGQTVKRDTRAWDNAPVAQGPQWKKGDRTSWETQIKTRQLGQHEDKRIYQ